METLSENQLEKQNVTNQSVAIYSLNKLENIIQTVNSHILDDFDFIVIACNSIWKVMSVEAVVSFVREKLIGLNNNFSYENINKVADELVRKACEQGAADNITTIVVVFVPDNISFIETDE